MKFTEGLPEKEENFISKESVYFLFYHILFIFIMITCAIYTILNIKLTVLNLMALLVNFSITTYSSLDILKFLKVNFTDSYQIKEEQ